MQDHVHLRTLNLAFDLTRLSTFEEDERLYRFSQWQTHEFIQTIDIFTEKEIEVYQSRIPSQFCKLPSLLSLDKEDLNKILEDRPMKMKKRYQREAFIAAIEEVKSGVRTQPPPSKSEQEVKDEHERSTLKVDCDFFVEEIKGVHHSQWPVIRERTECHVLIWYILNNRHKFKNKTILELGAGAHGLASLSLANMQVASKVIVTEGGVSNNDKIMDLLRKNCVSYCNNNAKEGNTALGVEHFNWNDAVKLNDIMGKYLIDNQLDIIIACDVLNYTMNMPTELLNSVYKMMNLSSTSRSEVVFYCVHNLWLGLSHLNSIKTCADDIGMVVKIIDPFKSYLVYDNTLPSPLNEFNKNDDVVVLAFQLKFPN